MVVFFSVQLSLWCSRPSAAFVAWKGDLMRRSKRDERGSCVCAVR